MHIYTIYTYRHICIYSRHLHPPISLPGRPPSTCFVHTRLQPRFSSLPSSPLTTHHLLRLLLHLLHQPSPHPFLPPFLPPALPCGLPAVLEPGGQRSGEQGPRHVSSGEPPPSLPPSLLLLLSPPLLPSLPFLPPSQPHPGGKLDGALPLPPFLLPPFLPPSPPWTLTDNANTKLSCVHACSRPTTRRGSGPS
ncbi:hypothetical protein Naga_102278g1 [Nannochloropsis gaditana]|uniref:Uncharacterized protein n=1 Tax=Nannochloropsis gaditana TaxID=72520 RepID=W7TIE1_9STRA|nr:hypothetical protein Naga_102278g1 [Nannochloropsis gaditana]